MPTPARTGPPPWPLRYLTTLLVGAGSLVLLDSRTTQLLVDAPDPDFDVTLEIDDSPEGWQRYVEGGGDVAKAKVEIERLHRRARAHLADAGAPRPDGLDPLLAIVRDRVDARISLEATPIEFDRASMSALEREAAAIPGATLVPIDTAVQGRDYSCAVGLSSAFAAATGVEVLDLDSFTPPTRVDAPRIVMTWTARASDRLYGGPGDRVLFPGIVLDATLQWKVGDDTLATLAAQGDPGQRFAFTTFAPAFPFGEPDVGGIVGAMIEAGCRDLGEQWIEELTGLAPAALAPDDEVTLADRCTRGEAQSCRAAAEDLRERDPDAALVLLETGCRSLGLFAGENCLAAADLALEQGGELGPVKAQIALQSGCDANDGNACLRLAALVSSDDDAHHLRLRACDLGTAAACLAAADDRATRSAVSAQVLARRACTAGEPDGCTRAAAIAIPTRVSIRGVDLEPGETVFDVRWGMWFAAQPGEVVWIASKSSSADLERRLHEPLAFGVARIFAAADAPPGVVPPPGTTTIVGLVDTPGDRVGQRCPPCPAERPTSMFPTTFSCTCLP